MDTFSAMQIVMTTMQGLTMFAALLLCVFFWMQGPERPAPPEKERWELDAEKVKARLDDPENVKEEFGKFMTTRVGGRLYALEEKVKDFADSTVTGRTSRVFLCSYVPGWRCVALAGVEALGLQTGVPRLASP